MPACENVKKFLHCVTKDVLVSQLRLDERRMSSVIEPKNKYFPAIIVAIVVGGMSSYHNIALAYKIPSMCRFHDSSLDNSTSSETQA